MLDKPVVIVDAGCRLAEGPLWHPVDEKLFWVDLPLGRLYQYDPEIDNWELLYQGEIIGGITIQEDGALLLFMAGERIQAWDRGELKTISPFDQRKRDFRFNDAITDPRGRVFTGTLAVARRRKGKTPAALVRKLRRYIGLGNREREGALYRLDLDGRLIRLMDSAGRPNGMGFSPDERLLYVTDSLRRTIYAWEYEADTGAIRNRRVLVDPPPGEGVPDGLTVDSQGYIWSAMFGGGCVVRYRPDGKVDRCVEIPTRKVSSLTFGGSDYRSLFVTTGGGVNRSVDDPYAGAIFRIDVETAGVAEHLSRIVADGGTT